MPRVRVDETEKVQCRMLMAFVVALSQDQIPSPPLAVMQVLDQPGTPG
jgi:hypothetical protein